MVLIILLGFNGQNNEGRSLFDKGSTNAEKWEAKSFRTRDGLWQVLIVWLEKIWKLRVNRTEVRQWPSEVCQDSGQLTNVSMNLAGHDMQSRWCSLQS